MDKKLPFERKPKVGSPIALIESLAEHINEQDPPSPFVIEPSPIVDDSDFWEFVQENRGNIATLIFDLITPNQFGTEHDFDREMRAMRESEKARRVKLQFENEDGLEPETRLVKEAVTYATRGGGSVRAKTRDHKQFRSRSRTQRVVIPEHPSQKRGRFDMVMNAIKVIFMI